MTSRSNRLLGPDTRPCVQKRVIVTPARVIVNNLVALLKLVQYVRIKKYLFINKHIHSIHAIIFTTVNIWNHLTILYFQTNINCFFLPLPNQISWFLDALNKMSCCFAKVSHVFNISFMPLTVGHNKLISSP